LSLDGRKLGTLAPINGLDNLVVIDLDKRKSAVITTFSSEDVSQFSWIDNNRFLSSCGTVGY